LAGFWGGVSIRRVGFKSVEKKKSWIEKVGTFLKQRPGGTTRVHGACRAGVGRDVTRKKKPSRTRGG